MIAENVALNAERTLTFIQWKAEGFAQNVVMEEIKHNTRKWLKP